MDEHALNISKNCAEHNIAKMRIFLKVDSSGASGAGATSCFNSTLALSAACFSGSVTGEEENLADISLYQSDALECLKG